MSLLSIGQSLTLRVLGYRAPVIAGAVDQKVLQAFEYINEAGQALARRHTWQALTNESTFTSVATEVQGTIQALSAPGFAFILNDILYDRTQRLPVFGPRSPQAWQAQKATLQNGPYSQFRIRQNQLLFNPAPSAGRTIAFEWVSSYWCADSNGVNPKGAFVQDSDAAFLDENVITLDAIWRFKRANKFSYDDDFLKAEDAITDLIGRDGTRQTLNLGGAQPAIWPGVFVPAGNWGH